MAAGSEVHRSVACPPSFHWNDGGLDRDLYIQINEVTVLAMDGRRRWLDIQKSVFVCIFYNIQYLKYSTYKEENHC